MLPSIDCKKEEQKNNNNLRRPKKQHKSAKEMEIDCIIDDYLTERHFLSGLSKEDKQYGIYLKGATFQEQNEKQEVHSSEDISALTLQIP